MADIFTFQTPQEGWGLVSHHLGNYLVIIPLYGNKTEDGRTIIEEDGVEKCARVVFDNHTKLVGALYMIVWNLNKQGHACEAAKVQQLLDMVVEQDVTDPAVVQAILAKDEELDPGVSEFRKVLA